MKTEAEYEKEIQELEAKRKPMTSDEFWRRLFETVNRWRVAEGRPVLKPTPKEGDE